MKEVKTLSEEQTEYYLVRLMKQDGKRADAPSIKWVVAVEAGSSHTKLLASGERRTYNNLSYNTTAIYDKATRFKDMAKAKRAAKVKFLQSFYEAGWTYQVIRIVDRVRVTREELIVEPINPLLALAQEAI